MEQNQSIMAGSLTGTRVTARIVRVVLFAGMTAVAAQIEVPHQPVPYTLQTLFVLLSGAILGARDGMLSQILYLFCGAIGLPVFSHFSSGLLHLIGPTGGYLLGFPIAAFVVGYLHTSGRYFRTLFSMFVGLFIIFSLGTLQLYFVYYHNFSTAISNGFLIFSWWDAVKVFAAAAIAKTIRPHFLQR